MYKVRVEAAGHAALADEDRGWELIETTMSTFFTLASSLEYLCKVLSQLSNRYHKNESGKRTWAAINSVKYDKVNDRQNILIFFCGTGV
jgi:hypothetical protein